MDALPAASTRLYRVIADRIAERINRGDFAVGSRLPAERDLAEQLQVSRASVREALIALEIEGHVDIRVGSGVYVTDAQSRRVSGARASRSATAAAPSAIGPFDLLEARLLVETECAALTAQKASKAQIAVIESAHLALADTGTPGVYDRAFHTAIAAACGNAALAATVVHLWSLSENNPVFARLEAHFVTHQVWRTAHLEHGRILEAIIDRDPIRARHAMHDHLVAILARLREDFGQSALLFKGE